LVLGFLLRDRNRDNWHPKSEGEDVITSLRETAQVRRELDDLEPPTFVVTSEEEAVARVGHIIEHFGQDRSRKGSVLLISLMASAGCGSRQLAPLTLAESGPQSLL
jgi:hypothetical protein